MNENLINANNKVLELVKLDLFEYDESIQTCLKWKHLRIGNGGKLVPRLNGGKAGSINSKGFLILSHKAKVYSIPKIVWIMHNGPIPEGYSVRHIDSDRLNTKISNLTLKKDSIVFLEKYSEDIKNFIIYDESSESCIRWLSKSSKGSNITEGALAGSLDALDGYWKLHAFGNNYKVHRIVWFLHNGKIPEDFHIDHINGKRHDNRIENLRLVVPEINWRNRTKNKNNTTGYNMISYYEGYNNKGTLIRRYDVSISFNGKFKSRSFSCLKYGDEVALKLAIECRDELLCKINAQGAGYSDRHGT